MLSLLHSLGLFLEPLLAIFANLLLQELVVALTTLAGDILEHLALSKGLGRVLFTIGRDGHAHVARLEAEQVTQSTNARGLGVFLLVLHLGVELLASNGFATGEFRGDVLAFEGLEDLADIAVLHSVDVFEERNQADELLVLGVTLPGVEDNRVFGLFANIPGLGVDDDDLGKIAVKVRKVLQKLATDERLPWIETRTNLDNLAVLVLGGFAVEGPHDESEGVQFANQWLAHGERNRCEKNQLIVLAQVAHKVVHSGALGDSPSVLSGPLAVDKQIIQAEAESVGALEGRVGIGKELVKSGILVVGNGLVPSGVYTSPPQADAPAIGHVRVACRLNFVFPVASQVNHATDGTRSSQPEHESCPPFAVALIR